MHCAQMPPAEKLRALAIFRLYVALLVLVGDGRNQRRCRSRRSQTPKHVSTSTAFRLCRLVAQDQASDWRALILLIEYARALRCRRHGKRNPVGRKIRIRVLALQQPKVGTDTPPQPEQL